MQNYTASRANCIAWEMHQCTFWGLLVMQVHYTTMHHAAFSVHDVLYSGTHIESIHNIRFCCTARRLAYRCIFKRTH